MVHFGCDPERQYFATLIALEHWIKHVGRREEGVVDPAIANILAKDGKHINFQWFRSEFGKDHGRKDELEYGHVIIQSIELLEQYLYTYGLMVNGQWNNVADLVTSMDVPDVVIDYGCGQGLAGLIINDITDGMVIERAQEIYLIEPSSLALDRAAALYQQLAPSARIVPLCKGFDDIDRADLPIEDDQTIWHIFSNSLDVEGYDPVALLNKTIRPGKNLIMAVSPDRDFKGGTPRIQMVKDEIERWAAASGDTVVRSTMKTFPCDNPKNSTSVVWLCELEIEDG